MEQQVNLGRRKLSPEQVEQTLHLSIKMAAEALGVGRNTLKGRRRELGLQRIVPKCIDCGAHLNTLANRRNVRCAFCAKLLANGRRVERYKSEEWRRLRNERVKQHYERNPDKIVYKVVRKYGLSVELYNAMLAAQGGGCAICQKPPQKNRLSVDHDHKTGLVRGLLCPWCNQHLIAFENKDFARRAQAYLREHEQRTRETPQLRDTGT